MEQERKVKEVGKWRCGNKQLCEYCFLFDFFLLNNDNSNNNNNSTNNDNYNINNKDNNAIEDGNDNNNQVIMQLAAHCTEQTKPQPLPEWWQCGCLYQGLLAHFSLSFLH